MSFLVTPSICSRKYHRSDESWNGNNRRVQFLQRRIVLRTVNSDSVEDCAPTSGREGSHQLVSTSVICHPTSSETLLESETTNDIQAIPQNIENRRPVNSTERATQTTDEIVPRRLSDVPEINRLRVQLFRKNVMRRLQKENESLKKNVSGYKSSALYSALNKCLQNILEALRKKKVFNKCRSFPRSHATVV